MSARRQDDQIFIRDGLDHYRRTYSMTEVRIGLVILGLIAGLAVWVGWKGSQPDPGLFSLDPALLDKGGGDAEKYAEKYNDEGGAAAAAVQASASGAKRGPVPEGLAADGWQERTLSSFDAENLYVKINGRADFYLELGFEKLYFIALSREDDESTTVDVEMYDMGNVENALGTYAGERQPDARTRLAESGLGHTSRNAAFLVRGRFYVRAIGSDESQAVLDALAHLEAVLDRELPAEPLPWGYAIFAGQMGVDPGSIKYAPSNAYSFGFANEVFSAVLDEEGMEIFVKAVASNEAAVELAARFVEGFQSYGEIESSADGTTWVKDHFLGNISGATGFRSLVIGVYSAPDVDAANAALARLQETVASLSDEVLERAAGAGASNDGGSGDEGDESHDVEGEALGEDEYGAEGEDEYGGEPGGDEYGEEAEGGAYESGGPGEGGYENTAEEEM